VIDPAPNQYSRERTTRGFLFADLRGYTNFVERQGDEVAALLLRDYRRLVRDVVARFGGAEIKTEGDSFYVVFSSASKAVECGLALVDEARTATAQVPERPIAVGVGIHAGETVESEGGFVGSAVNIAARVCAVARAGEVTVTDTVRGLLRTSLPVHFVPRGTPKLKGIEQPIAVFAVVRGIAAHPSPDRRLQLLRARRGRIVAAGLALLTVGLAAAVAFAAGIGPWARQGMSTGPSHSTTPAASKISAPTRITSRDVSGRFRPKALAPGTYELPDVEPAVSFALGTPNWVLRSEFADSFTLERHLAGSSDVDAYIYGMRARLLLDGPCLDSPRKVIGTDPASVIAALQANPWLSVTEPESVSLGGRSGFRVDVQQSRSPREACVIPQEEEWRAESTFLFLVGNDDNYWIGPNERVRIAALDVGDATFLVLVGVPHAADFDVFMQSAQPILDSLALASS
jgi:class 3 adenylate cyclase